MRILQVIDKLEVGGAERIFVHLCNLLREKGQKVGVVFLRWKGPLAEGLHPDIEVHSLESRAKFDWRAAQKLVRLAKQYDVVHAHMRSNYRYCRLAGMLFGMRKPIILHDHSSNLKMAFWRIFSMKTILKPKAYIAVSRDLVKWAKEELKVRPDRVFLLENVIVRQFLAAHPEREGLVLVSNFKPGKNHRFAVELMKHLDEKLTIYGKVNDEDYYQGILQQIRELGVDEKVRLVHDANDIQTELVRFKAGLHTSEAETGPLAIMEYLAQELPFVTYRTGEVVYKIEAQLPDFVVDNFNAPDWLDRVDRILAGKYSKEKMNRTFEQHFSSENYVKKCLKIYKDILGY